VNIARDDWNITFAPQKSKKQIEFKGTTSWNDENYRVSLKFPCWSGSKTLSTFRLRFAPLSLRLLSFVSSIYILRLFIDRLRIYRRARTAEFAPCFYWVAATSRRVSSDRIHLQFWHIWRWDITQCTLFAGESVLLETKGREYPTSYVAGTWNIKWFSERFFWSISRRLFVSVLSIVADVVSRSSFGASWHNMEGHVPSFSFFPLFCCR